MSHHLEDSRLNLRDLYLFPGEQGLTMIMTMNSSLVGDERQPGFHPEGRYEFKVHIDDGAYEEFTYRFSFGHPDGAGQQAVRLHQLLGRPARSDEETGELIAEGRTGAAVDGDDGLRVYAGPVADPFYLDLRQLALIDEAVQNATRANLSGWWNGPARNSMAESTVESIVLELPADGPFAPHQHIGVWSAAKVPDAGEGWRQVDRAGIAMTGRIFRPDTSAFAREANEIHPAEDLATDGKRIAELTAGIAGAYGTAESDIYGEELAARLLPDLLPYHVGSAAGFSFAGINGRELADNAAEVMFSLVANAGITTRISPQETELTRQDLFPYVVPA